MEQFILLSVYSEYEKTSEMIANTQRFIPFDENEEFYNAVSGNMIDFNENVDTNVNI